MRAGDDLDDAFAWKEERTLSQALTLQYDKVMFILEPSEQAKAAIGKRLTVVDYPDGRLAIRYRGVELAYRTLTNCARSRRPQSLRTNSSAPCLPSSATSSFVASLNIAAIAPHAGAISTTRVCLKSAELFYEPSVLTPARSKQGSRFRASVQRAPVGRYATPGAPRPPVTRTQGKGGGNLPRSRSQRRGCVLPPIVRQGIARTLTSYRA